MWLAKPLYEALPYYYVAAGAACLAALPYLEHSNLGVIAGFAGVASLVAGLVVWLKRRGVRASRLRRGDEDS
jgi:hypothetical protein